MPRILFVTGILAADALRGTLAKLEQDVDYDIVVIDTHVAALLRTVDVALHLSDARGCDEVMLPGLCRGDLEVLGQRLGVPVVRGPKDLKDLPTLFGREAAMEGYGEYETRIVAEIVEAWQLPWQEILAQAEYYREAGADVMDLGCPPMEGFDGAGETVARLRERGFTVSIDTFDVDTIREADEAGVDLVLSVNSQNMAVVPHVSCPVVVIPDFGEGLESLERNAARVAEMGASYVLDPILDPLSFGFTAALDRFYRTRQAHPEAPMLMGLGNLTELTDADSTGINAVMAGVAAELRIDYVLTTEVISWARGAVRELDVGRRLMHYALKNRVLPKSLDDRLIALKDTPYEPYTEAELRAMQGHVTDRHHRIFADHEQVYVFNRDVFVAGTEPAAIFAELPLADPGHAFYLGRELERAALAVRLGKRYTQESQLRWGYLSRDEEA